MKGGVCPIEFVAAALEEPGIQQNPGFLRRDKVAGSGNGLGPAQEF
jgi:hypothetical protein